MAWNTSNRQQRLPHNWFKIKQHIKQRDKGQCQGINAHEVRSFAHLKEGSQGLYHHPDCDLKGCEVDHIQQGDNHNTTNLRLLSTPCHKLKTAEENASRQQCNATARRRPHEKHPGMI